MVIILSGDEIEDGKAFKGGEGRAGAIYSWKGRQLLEKRVYLTPDIATQLEKLGVVSFQRQVAIWIPTLDSCILWYLVGSSPLRFLAELESGVVSVTHTIYGGNHRKGRAISDPALLTFFKYSLEASGSWSS